MITKTLTGFSSREQALEKMESLRQAYSAGYGFYPQTPVENAGVWSFTYSRGSSCD